MTVLSLREATGSDTAALAALWEKCGLIRPWNDPASDIALALNHSASVILVGEVAENADCGFIAASAMVGFDGHRGWIYYVAVDPDQQGAGFARQIMTAAEDWLRDQGCPKVEVIIRAENLAVQDVYKALGYKKEPRAIMTKWLKEPPAVQGEEAAAPLMPVTITWLEMLERPTRPSRPMPTIPGRPISLQRVYKPSVAFYRYVQHGIGDPWLWFERRSWTDEKLLEVIQDDAVEINILYVGGEPAGLAELDFRGMPDRAELAYFGLLPHFIGAGLGPYLLDWAIAEMWHKDPAPGKLLLNTCTLDHPSALGGYQKAGFVPYNRTKESFPDPVAMGVIPKTVTIKSPGYPFS